MPWDGSNNYQYPPGTEGVPDQTIESIKYNTFIADLRDNDLNKPRPITRGGTGAVDAVTALSNLGGEKAQQVVTNYDSMTWLSGSFYSAAGATSAPVAGHRFVGVVSVQDPNNIVIQAFDLDSTPAGEMYTKIKKDGVWQDSGAWGTGFVKKSGDTMTGVLTLAGPAPSLKINAPIGYGNDFFGMNNNKNRWLFRLGDGAGESTGNVGSNFALYRYADDGTTVLGAVLSAVRSTGSVAVGSTEQSTAPNTGALVVAGGLGVVKNTSFGAFVRFLYDPGTPGGGGYYATTTDQARFFVGTDATDTLRIFTSSFGNALSVNGATGEVTLGVSTPTSANGIATKQSSVAKTGDTMTGALTAPRFFGPIEAATGSDSTLGDLTCQRNATQGVVHFGSNRTGYIFFDGADFNFTGGRISTIAPTGVNHVVTKAYADDKASRINPDAIATNWSFLVGSAGSGFWFSTGVGGSGRFFIGSDGVSSDTLRIFAAGIGNVIVIGVSGPIIFNTSLYMVNGNNRWQTDGVFVITATGYKPGGGPWSDSSDARIKTVESEYPLGLAEVCALRPVIYKFKGNDTLEPPENNPPQPSQNPPDVNSAPPPKFTGTAVVPYSNSGHYQAAVDGKKFVGLIAQEVEAIFPDMVTKRAGYIDGVAVNDVHDLDTTSLIFALVNSVKQLAARVEQLEA